MNRAAQLLLAKRVFASTLLAVFASLPPVHSPAEVQSTAATMSMIGTVRTVDTQSRAIEIVTGVGYATRVMRLEIAEDCTIVVPRAAAHLTSFVPGTVVRVQYSPPPATRTRGVAVAIEALDVEGPKGQR